jgi:hypothetical protein
MACQIDFPETWTLDARVGRRGMALIAGHHRIASGVALHTSKDCRDRPGSSISGVVSDFRSVQSNLDTAAADTIRPMLAPTSDPTMTSPG